MSVTHPDIISRGWEIVKALNGDLTTVSSIEARKMLAEYAKMMQLPRTIGDDVSARNLHSAILSVAVKMALAYTDFHFVPFLDMWGLENLRSEDSDGYMKDGKRYPSLVEKMAKAYAHSLLFHPDEHLDEDLESVIYPHLQTRGYILSSITTVMLATKVFTSEVNKRNMTFITLITTDGTEMIAEVHTITAHHKLRYEEIPGKLFSCLVRKSRKGTIRIEAAILSSADAAETFPTAIGYIERHDDIYGHLHIFDNQSRHLVAMTQTGTIGHQQSLPYVGTFVQFIPLIPKQGTFKTAVITRVLSPEEGAEAFGYRRARVTYINKEKGYASWELLEGEAPVQEENIPTPSCTKGFINLPLLTPIVQSLGMTDVTELLNHEISIITYLKRGKDREKRPMVVKVKE